MKKILSFLSRWSGFILTLLVALAMGVFGGYVAVFCFGITFDPKIKLASFALFVSGAIGLYLLSKRTDYMSDQTKELIKQTKNQTQEIQFQIEKGIEDRFHAAIGLLGGTHTSGRTGALYSLYHLAVDNERYRKEVPQILCSHIRSVTGEADYQKAHALAPSNEIQTALNLLFKQDGSGGFVGLYRILLGGKGKLACADLSGAYLVGMRFNKMVLQCAIFAGANCANTIFVDSNCQCASFQDAAVQGAWFLKVNCQGASFQAAHCQFMKMEITQCQFSNFAQAQCQRAKLSGCEFDGANFSNSGFQRAHIVESNFCDAYADGMGGAELTDYADLSWRIGKGTRLKTAKSAGAVPGEHVARIHKMQQMLSAVPFDDATSIYDRLQEIIQENAGSADRFVFPKQAGNFKGAAQDAAAEDAHQIADELVRVDGNFLSNV